MVELEMREGEGVKQEGGWERKRQKERGECKERLKEREREREKERGVGERKE